MNNINNNVSRIRRELLINICSVLLDGDTAAIDRVPYDMRPREKSPLRCCVHKDRAVLRDKLMALFGYQSWQEKDEMVPLQYYLNNEKSNSSFITVVNEACSSCQPGTYKVSNLCRSCEARPCQVNCPKGAISFKEGQAFIDSSKCVNCGICMKECPYNAISYQPRPCEEACPVDAIHMDENGHEHIDVDKCILCGNCLRSCPFGAILPSTSLPRLIRDIKSEKEVIAIVAPSIKGQFRNSPENIYGGIIQAGFSQVAEVAYGAALTTLHEGQELEEHILDGKMGAMTSSCCPSYTMMVKKHIPELNAIVSQTVSPMEYTASVVKQLKPESIIVFIGPCISKKAEAGESESCDYAITFEEMGAMLVAKGIEVSESPKHKAMLEGNSVDHGYASAGGVTEAIKGQIKSQCEVEIVDGLTKPNMRRLKQLPKESKPVFVEVMSCEGGCLGGCGTLTSIKQGRSIMKIKTRS
jgi:[FeFe] hydrogenase (group B1/B3)